MRQRGRGSGDGAVSSPPNVVLTLDKGRKATGLATKAEVKSTSLTIQPAAALATAFLLFMAVRWYGRPALSGRAWLAWLAAAAWVAYWGQPVARRVKLKPTLALVTGSSSGIGRHIARLLARDGHSVIVHGRSQQTLDMVAQELRGEHNDIAVHTLVADLSQPLAGEAIFAALHDAGLRVPLLVNNAGFGVTVPFHESDLDALQSMVMCNNMNLMTLSRLFVPAMAAAGGGKILHTASLASAGATPGFVAYGATKAFVHWLSIGMQHELSASKVPVGVTSLCPGSTHTGFAKRAGMTAAPAFNIGIAVTPEFVAKVGYNAWMRGATWVVPSMLSYIFYIAICTVPYTISLRIAHFLLANSKH